MNSKEIKETIQKNLEDFRQEELEDAIKVIEKNRYKSAGELLESLHEELEVTKQELIDRLSLLYSKFSDNPNFYNLTGTPLDRTNQRAFKKEITRILKEFDIDGVIVDSDFRERIESGKTNATLLDYFLLPAIAQMERLYSEIYARLSNFFEESTKENIDREAFEIFAVLGVGILLDYDKIDLEDITHRTWRSTGSSWDETLWYNKRVAVEDIKKAVLANAPLEDGQDLSEDRIEKIVNRHENAVRRITVTDSTHFALEGHRDLMEFLDIEKSIFTAVLDNVTTEICRGRDGSIINNDDIREGENAPPMHENCRSVLCPYIDLEWSLDFGTRAARDIKTGKTYYVPASMTYREWQKTTQTEE